MAKHHCPEQLRPIKVCGYWPYSHRWVWVWQNRNIHNFRQTDTGGNRCVCSMRLFSSRSEYLEPSPESSASRNKVPLAVRMPTGQPTIETLPAQDTRH